ncbi:MAG: hypothetical protein IJQ82_04155 [Selenomonadaceae bacterium]|nr:hypothetical protein [Selenomonadaceae bacterium]
MSLVINTNEQATRIHGMYSRNNTQMNAAMTRVATAQKINSARDGASNWAISEKMRERIRANDQANQNVQNDTALLKTAQGGIGNTLDILKTLKERAVNAANDSNITTDRSTIATEIKSLVAQIDDNAAKVKFNGRALLNGAVDSSTAVGGSNGAEGVTAIDPRGVGAAYSLTSFKVAGSNGLTTAGNANGSDLLTALVDSSGNSLLQAGDKITLSWKENGQEVSKSLTVADDTAATGLSDLSAGSLTVSWKSANTAIDSGNILNESFADLKSTSAGIYAYSTDAKTLITDVALSVTRNVNGATSNVNIAQDALQFDAVQQAFGPLNGTNAVFELKTNSGNIDSTTNTAGITATTSTLKAMGLTTNDNDSIKITVDGKSITLSGTDTIDTANEAFKKAGINARLQHATKGTTLKYDGTEVMRGTAENQGAAKSGHMGVYLIGGAGEDITNVKFETKISTASTYTDGNTSKVLNLDSGNSGGASALLPQGSALQFYIGGETGFGVNFSIGKATASNLLGMGTDSFANRFLTKEGATSAISIIDNAITKTLNEQTRLGAMESRLGYTSDNILTMNENLEAADSAIRDSDMAKEMTSYMKYAVLAQASQYMLAQAGQNAYQVLNLLNA